MQRLLEILAYLTGSYFLFCLCRGLCFLALGYIGRRPFTRILLRRGKQSWRKLAYKPSPMGKIFGKIDAHMFAAELNYKMFAPAPMQWAVAKLANKTKWAVCGSVKNRRARQAKASLKRRTGRLPPTILMQRVEQAR